MLWSDQTSSTSSSLPFVGGSPQSIYHPQPLRGTRSSLLDLQSPSPESASSIEAQRGSQVQAYEINCSPAFTLNTRSSNFGHKNPSFSLLRTSPKSQHGPRERDAVLGHINSLNSNSALVPSKTPSKLGQMNKVSHREARSTSPENTNLYPATEDHYQLTVATCGSTRSTSHTSPLANVREVNSPTTSLFDSLDSQDLVHLLHELNEGTHHIKTSSKKRQSDTNSPTSHSIHFTNAKRTNYTHLRNLNPTASSDNTTIPPFSTRKPLNTNAQLTNPSPGRTPLSADAISKIPQPTVPASPCLSPKPDTLYRQPQFFVGRLASSQQTPETNSHSCRLRKRHTRLDIRCLPNYDEDPIDDM